MPDLPKSEVGRGGREEGERRERGGRKEGERGERENMRECGER